MDISSIKDFADVVEGKILIELTKQLENVGDILSYEARRDPDNESGASNLNSSEKAQEKAFQIRKKIDDIVDKSRLVSSNIVFQVFRRAAVKVAEEIVSYYQEKKSLDHKKRSHIIESNLLTILSPAEAVTPEIRNATLLLAINLIGVEYKKLYEFEKKLNQAISQDKDNLIVIVKILIYCIVALAICSGVLKIHKTLKIFSDDTGWVLFLLVSWFLYIVFYSVTKSWNICLRS